MENFLATSQASRMHTFDRFVSGEKILDDQITNLVTLVRKTAQSTLRNATTAQEKFHREVSWTQTFLERHLKLQSET